MPIFHYVYVLRSQKDKGFYVGSTPDLKSRLAKHNNGKVFSTKPRLPFDQIFYEAYRNESDASRREIYLKSTKGRTTLKSMFKDFLRESECQLV